MQIQPAATTHYQIDCLVADGKVTYCHRRQKAFGFYIGITLTVRWYLLIQMDGNSIIRTLNFYECKS